MGNGSILVNFDFHGQLQDFYFPYIGLENHVRGDFHHRIGVWVDDKFSWLNNDEWHIKINCEPDTFSGKIEAVNHTLEVEITLTNVVYNEDNVLLRQIVVKNISSHERSIKLFFCQQFELYESRTAHTAYYDPINQAVIHYRNRRVFLVNAQIEGRSFDDYTTGIFGFNGQEGSHVDARDGCLSKNPIEHGQVDSVIGISDNFTPSESKFAYQWITVASSIREAIKLNDLVLSKGPGYLIKTTQDYWRAWLNRQDFNFYGLSDNVIDLFKKSLLHIRAHADVGGGIIASSDSSMLQKGKDTYAYVWPRDAAYICLALNRVGDFLISKRFFEFCNKVITEEGYLMHKYSPDLSLGSSWHPWVRDGHVHLPIQEDETASVLVCLWNYYSISKDLEFIESVYNTLVKKGADFMVTYRDSKTGLPKPSYDIWEEKYGVHTYTAASVYGALVAAARFAGLLGKIKSERIYLNAAEQVKAGIMKNLYDPEEGVFYKSINWVGEEMVPDKTIDTSSWYGLLNFGVLDPKDDKLLSMYKIAKEKLTCPTASGGIWRYENDRYYSQSEDQSNPWLITTLWSAQYLIDLAQNESDLTEVKNTLEWVVSHASSAGTLSEQLDPSTGWQLGATPLIWSHSEFVSTVIKYLDKIEEMGIRSNCNPVY